MTSTHLLVEISGGGHRGFGTMIFYLIPLLQLGPLAALEHVVIL